MHTPYEQRLKHKTDFRVKYRFYTKEEGGRETLPYQGIRLDFSYLNKEQKQNEIFIIWPEFEDENGNVILEINKSVYREGTARMWIIIPERRSYHKGKIKDGTKGFFREGKIIAECEVIEIIGLNENPTESRK